MCSSLKDLGEIGGKESRGEVIQEDGPCPTGFTYALRSAQLKTLPWLFLNFYRAHLHIQLLTSHLLDVSRLRHVKLGLVTRPQPSMFSYCSSSLQMLKPENQKSRLISPPPMIMKSITRFYASKYLSSLPFSLEPHWCCPSSSPNHLATAVTSKPVSLCSKSFLHMAATFFQDANLMSFLLLIVFNCFLLHLR